ncbi:hypothetical protein OAI33_12475 [Pirellulaceae bacterium]|nr:hypothetical protein [Pirellulaceae bacterium]
MGMYKLTTTVVCVLTIFCFGCGEGEMSLNDHFQAKLKIENEIKANGTVTPEQAEYIAAHHNNGSFGFKGLTSVGWEEVEHISKFEIIALPEVTSISGYVALGVSEAKIVTLPSLTSIDDKAAENLGHLNRSGKWNGSTLLDLRGLTSVTPRQLARLALGQNVRILNLSGVTSLTDEHAEILTRGKQRDQDISFTGLTSLTEEQAEILSRSISRVFVPEEFKPLIDKYKKQ